MKNAKTSLEISEDESTNANANVNASAKANEVQKRAELQVERKHMSQLAEIVLALQ